MSSDEVRPLLFGPASSSLSSSPPSSSSFPRTISQNSLVGNLSADVIDLGEIFDDDFFPEDLDFTAFFQDMEAGTPGLAHSRSIGSGLPQQLPPPPRPYPSSISTSSNPTNEMIKVPLPIKMPRIALNNNFKAPVVKIGARASADQINELNNGKMIGNDISYNDDDLGNEKNVGLYSRDKINRDDIEDVTVKQKLERRERNREHAKRSRIRKKVLLDSLQDELLLVREENIKLRRIVAERIPHKAHSILENCTALESSLLSSNFDGDGDHVQQAPKLRSLLDMELGRASMVGDEIKQHAKILMEPDYRLIHSLVVSQQNFVLSDPSLPDNPIVYASEGFCKLSGYKRDDILGRNCRFLQGPGTDQNAVEVIREGVAAGRDISVCLLNYKADGTPFWNQFFVGALRDSEGNVVNFVGVQCEVNIVPVTKIKDRVKKLPIPDY